VAWCHRTMLAYWKFESISLQRRVRCELGFLQRREKRTPTSFRAVDGVCYRARQKLARKSVPTGSSALSQMLGTIEADLAGGKLDSMQVEPLRWRAELMRRLLTPSQVTRSLTFVFSALIWSNIVDVVLGMVAFSGFRSIEMINLVRV